MITIRNTFCAIMLASAASLMAMDADKAVHENYAREQVRLALNRVTIPAGLSEDKINNARNNAIKVAIFFGAPSENPTDYDNFVAVALKGEVEGPRRHWCGTCQQSQQQDDSK